MVSMKNDIEEISDIEHAIEAHKGRLYRSRVEYCRVAASGGRTDARSGRKVTLILRVVMLG